MSEKSKLRPEEKVRIIRKYKDGGISLRGAAEEAGVERETLRQWIIQYEAEGVAAFLSNRRNRIYKPELKRRAVQEYLSGGGSYMKQGRETTQKNAFRLSRTAWPAGRTTARWP